MAIIIIDDNIQLRPFEVADAQELFDAVNNSRKHLHPWLDWVGKTTRPEHSLEFIQASLHELHTQRAMALGIFCDNKIVGGMGMHHWDHETKKAQIGYWIIDTYQGKGIINRGMVKLIGYLFDKIRLNKIELHFVAANKRSAKVATRLGFKLEGVIRQSVIRNGMTEDLVITGLLRSEWIPPGEE